VGSPAGDEPRDTETEKIANRRRVGTEWQRRSSSAPSRT
jgi:hypothetical protein